MLLVPNNFSGSTKLSQKSGEMITICQIHNVYAICDLEHSSITLSQLPSQAPLLCMRSEENDHCVNKVIT